MLIISESALTNATQALVMATHTAVTIEGRRYQIGTIDGATLRAATLAAISVICRTPVDTLGPDALPPQT